MKLHVLGVSGPFPESNGATSVLYSLEAGDTVQVIIYRNYKQYSAQLQLDEAK